MKHLVERFLRYVTFDTQSNPHESACPSSSGQLVFAQLLKKEMIELGLSNVTLSDNGYLMAKLPSNVDYDVPAIGFIAHMDTAPDASGKNVNPQFIEDYQVVILHLVWAMKCFPCAVSRLTRASWS